MTPVVVDASAAVPWFLPEPVSPAAECLLEGPRLLIAPDLLLTEVANVLLTNARRGTVRPGHAAAALRMLRRPGQITWFAVPPLLDAAVAIAEEVGDPLYDCLYLALAQSRHAAVATFDRRMTALAQRLSIPLWAAEDKA